MDATDWDARYAASELVWSTGPNRFVEQELAGLPPGRALDLACGEGRNALWLAEQGWRVTALDYSAVAVAKGRRLGDERGLGIDWRVGDALTAPLPRDLDLVLVAYLQIPAAERTTVLRRAHEALVSGGTLLVVGHDSSNLDEGTGGPQHPGVLYTADDLLADLRGLPVETLRADRVARAVPDPDGGSDLTAWDVLLRVLRS